jgi:hypothetical protein
VVVWCGVCAAVSPQAVVTRYGAWEVDDAQPVLVEIREVPGGSSSSSSTAGGAGGGLVEIVVTDSGHGIPSGTHLHMYDYFWSGNKPTNTL